MGVRLTMRFFPLSHKEVIQKIVAMQQDRSVYTPKFIYTVMDGDTRFTVEFDDHEDCDKFIHWFERKERWSRIKEIWRRKAKQFFRLK